MVQNFEGFCAKVLVDFMDSHPIFNGIKPFKKVVWSSHELFNEYAFGVHQICMDIGTPYANW